MEQNHQNILIVRSKIIFKPQSTGTMGLVGLKHFEGSRNSIQERVGVWILSFWGDPGREGEQRLTLCGVPDLSTGSSSVYGQLSCQGSQVTQRLRCVSLLASDSSHSEPLGLPCAFFLSQAECQTVVWDATTVY